MYGFDDRKLRISSLTYARVLSLYKPTQFQQDLSLMQQNTFCYVHSDTVSQSVVSISQYVTLLYLVWLLITEH